MANDCVMRLHVEYASRLAGNTHSGDHLHVLSRACTEDEARSQAKSVAATVERYILAYYVREGVVSPDAGISEGGT